MFGFFLFHYKSFTQISFSVFERAKGHPIERKLKQQQKKNFHFFKSRSDGILLS